MKKLVIVIILFIIELQATDLSTFINNKNCNQIIDKQVYTICYDYKYKGALFVAYTLDGNKVNAVNISKRPSFYTEKNLQKQYRSNNRDYIDSGYDRGHLAPHASFDYDEKVVLKTYSMANIIPQAPTVNRKLWVKAETLERQVASSLGSVNVLNGVVYNENPIRIGENQIAVPKAFWKMIYNDEKNYKRCLYYLNDLNATSKDDKLKSHVVACENLGKN